MAIKFSVYPSSWDDMGTVTSTVREEAEIGRRHTPDFGGRTLLLEGTLLVFFIGSTAFAVAGAIPIWVAFLCNLVVLYSLYTVVHEAVHSNISSRRKSLRWIDGVIACDRSG